jgi:hypothetical protein
VCLLALTLVVAAFHAPHAAADDADSLYGDAEYEEAEAAGFPDPCETSTARSSRRIRRSTPGW